MANPAARAGRAHADARRGGTDVDEASGVTEIDDGAANVEWVRSELQTPTLSALREVMAVGAQVGPSVARRAGLSHSELEMLERLAERPHGPAELAKQLGVTTAAATQIVDRLVARGHATRRKRESDGRRTEVVISESGRAEAVGHLMPMFAALGRLDATLTPEEAQAVTRYLRGAVDAMRALL